MGSNLVRNIQSTISTEEFESPVPDEIIRTLMLGGNVLVWGRQRLWKE